MFINYANKFKLENKMIVFFKIWHIWKSTEYLFAGGIVQKFWNHIWKEGKVESPFWFLYTFNQCFLRIKIMNKCEMI